MCRGTALLLKKAPFDCLGDFPSGYIFAFDKGVGSGSSERLKFVLSVARFVIGAPMCAQPLLATGSDRAVFRTVHLDSGANAIAGMVAIDASLR